ncbi:hypothetical protein JW899_02730 [Candidatus Uhrbacteria bacterium]|nr:hypothetical protein [Candidatus Uhrbacteria bacterium]
MYMVVHAAVGAAAGQAVEHVSVAFVLGVVSHFFLDMIPHGDENLYQAYIGGKGLKKGLLHVGFDVLATIVFCTAIYLNREVFVAPNVVFWGVVGGLIPDFLVALSGIFRPRRKRGLVWRLDRYNAFHRWNHSLLMRKWRCFRKDVPYVFGAAYQAVILVILAKMIL